MQGFLVKDVCFRSYHRLRWQTGGPCFYSTALSPGVMKLRPPLIQGIGNIRHKGVVFQGRVTNEF